MKSILVGLVAVAMLAVAPMEMALAAKAKVTKTYGSGTCKKGEMTFKCCMEYGNKLGRDPTLRARWCELNGYDKK